MKKAPSPSKCPDCGAPLTTMFAQNGQRIRICSRAGVIPVSNFESVLTCTRAQTLPPAPPIPDQFGAIITLPITDVNAQCMLTIHDHESPDHKDKVVMIKQCKGKEAETVGTVERKRFKQAARAI